MRYCFVLYFLSIRKVDPVDRVYKEWSDLNVTGNNSGYSSRLKWRYDEILVLFYVKGRHNNRRVFRNSCSQHLVHPGPYVYLTGC